MARVFDPRAQAHELDSLPSSPSLTAYCDAATAFRPLLEAVGMDGGRTASVTVKDFLNRLLGVGVGHQNELFDFFSKTLARVVVDDKTNGKKVDTVAGIQ